MSAFNVYDVSRQTVFIASNMKVIKTQSEPKPSYFPKGSFGKKVECNRTYGDFKIQGRRKQRERR